MDLDLILQLVDFLMMKISHNLDLILQTVYLDLMDRTGLFCRLLTSPACTLM